MYDAIIIGSGPAGLSTALNLQIHEKSFVWFGSRDMSDKIKKAQTIDNYPGLPGIGGQELLSRFDEHRARMGITITEKTVTNIMPVSGHYMVLADNEMYEAKTLALCMGVVNAKPLAGEEEFLADLAEEVFFFPAYPKAGVQRENVRVSTDYPVKIDGSLKVTTLMLRSGEEPCPFSPYSDTSLCNMTLREALHSPLFVKLNENGNLLKEHIGGCVLYEQEEQVKALVQGETA